MDAWLLAEKFMLGVDFTSSTMFGCNRPISVLEDTPQRDSSGIYCCLSNLPQVSLPDVEKPNTLSTVPPEIEEQLMRIVWLFLIITSLTGCPVEPMVHPTSIYDDCESFSLTKGMWEMAGSQAKAQFMACLDPFSQSEEKDLSFGRKLAMGITGRLLFCPMVPVMPVVFGMSLMIMTPVIFLPMDLLSSKSESCNDKEEEGRH
ncbi:MAG: hypothetical protein ACU83V_12455 [Gammaproteobacteria bacterium]